MNSDLEKMYNHSSLKWQWGKPFSELSEAQIRTLQKIKSKMPETNEYDSKPETLEHIYRVRQLLRLASKELNARALRHDKSKLKSPEKEMFDRVVGRLKGCTYGSEEYKGYLKELKPALEHHYANNSHHPEHYENGVNGMDLFDLIEMFFDWKAATERHADGSIMKSIEINRERFGISDQLCDIMKNTVERWRNEI